MKKDIEDKVSGIIDDTYTVVDKNYVPDVEDSNLTFANTGVRFEATVLFIDIRDSTSILNKHNRKSVAKLHKAYFYTIVKIAREGGGEVRSFNGDGMLVFFQGTTKNSLSNAVKTAMQMRYMLSQSKVKDKMAKYSAVNFGIGIDHGKILCAKVGISGLNNKDLVWIGNSVNKAAKLSDTLYSPSNIGITHHVYDNLNDDVKYHVTKDSYGYESKVDMWEWSTFQYNESQETSYTTSYYWTVS